MLRPALAVLIATVLLGLALPVVDGARVSHADSQVKTGLDDLETAARQLQAESDPSVSDGPAPRIERTIVLPSASWGRAGVERLTIPADGNGTVRWRVADGRTRTFESSPPLVAPPDGLTIREAGRHRLRLSLQRRGGEQVVVVTRADVYNRSRDQPPT